MGTKTDALTQEVDAYIRHHFRPGGVPRGFLGKLPIGETTDYRADGTTWALSFLLKKLEMTFSEKLLQLIDDKGRKPAEVYAKASGKISLSKMTFNHQMVRTVFAEQLYRAFTILKGEPYHHE